jgi:hypothetical protein
LGQLSKFIKVIGCCKVTDNVGAVLVSVEFRCGRFFSEKRGPQTATEYGLKKHGNRL